VSAKLKIDFVFDVGSSNAYLSHRVLPDITKRTGVPFEYVPVLLGGIFKATNNASPFDAFKNIESKLKYQEIETQRFVKRHGLHRYHFNPNFPINTLALMRGAIAAQRLELFPAYVEAVFCGMWEDGRKMDEPNVVRTALVEAGLPADDIIALAQDPAVKQQLVDNTSTAVKRGVFGAPTFFVGEEMYFGKDRLEQVEEASLDLTKA
jgi:2-hydroxychromene-2-carboxylate isomerase